METRPKRLFLDKAVVENESRERSSPERSCNNQLTSKESMTDRLDVPRYRKWRLPQIVDRAISIGEVESDDDETRRTKRLLAGAMWIAIVTPWPSILQFIAADALFAGVAVSFSLLSALVVLVTLWLRPSRYTTAFHVLVAINILVNVAMTLMFGGFLESGANFVWSVILVLGALAIFGDWRATLWLGISVVSFVGSLAATRFVEPLYTHPDPELGAVLTMLIVLIFAYVVLYYYVRQRGELLQISNGLLQNILPQRIAERLKRSDEMIADEYESASILFADVAGFTPMSADLSPNELVALLNEIFTDFDEMVDARDLEKIKTIGDAYMVAAGVPLPRSDHAVAICDLALEMQRRVEGRTFSGHNITFRIGINSGPVVAGIIGTRKFSYDLWGDSVNTASRMESFGRAGQIQVTEATKELIANEFVCVPGGEVEVKGKGLMKVWFVEGRQP